MEQHYRRRWHTSIMSHHRHQHWGSTYHLFPFHVKQFMKGTGRRIYPLSQTSFFYNYASVVIIFRRAIFDQRRLSPTTWKQCSTRNTELYLRGGRLYDHLGWKANTLHLVVLVSNYTLLFYYFNLLIFYYYVFAYCNYVCAWRRKPLWPLQDMPPRAYVPYGRGLGSDSPMHHDWCCVVWFKD